MPIHQRIPALIATTLILSAIGCEQNENERLADMAEKHLERQAEQNRQIAELQQQVAEGTKRLVEVDAESRKG